MALTRLANTIFASTDDQLVGKFILLGILFTSTGVNSSFELHDEDSATPVAASIKFAFESDLRADSRFFDFSKTPVRFEQAINVFNMTNAAITLIIKEIGT